MLEMTTTLSQEVPKLSVSNLDLAPYDGYLRDASRDLAGEAAPLCANGPPLLPYTRPTLPSGYPIYF